MARFTKNTISQIGGFSDLVLAEELLYGTNQYWDLTITDDSTGEPIDLTGWTAEAKVIRRAITAIEETRNGIDIQGLTQSSTATEVDMTSGINFYNPQAGKVRFIIDDALFTDASSIVDTATPPVYTGYLQLILPGVGTSGSSDYIPAIKKKILLMFIIRSDGFSL
jgi:hypothetical protein